MFGTLSSSIRNLGIRSVYTGLSAALMRQLSYSMVRFGCYEHIKNTITDGGKKRPKAIQLVLAGGIAGGLGGIAGNPADVLLVRMTTDEVRPPKERFNYKNAVDGLIRLVREEGVSALGRGLSANVTRAVLMNCSQLASYDFFKNMILHSAHIDIKDGIALHASCSVMSGLVATSMYLPAFVLSTSHSPNPAICSPADVIKSRVMQNNNTSMLEVVKTSFRTEGVKFLFKGWTPAFVRLAPNTVLLFVFLEVFGLLL
ncbi:Mitochondrial dicarboxylate transporter [Ceratobasidium sp. 428]|nr:Mitochondrial dicarboxylate transporter [Ceratobasidium sp. 428]